MTEQQGQAAQDITDEQRQAIIDDYRRQAEAEAAQAGGPPSRAQAAEAAVAQVQAPAGDAGASLGMMTTDKPARLPAEDLMDKLMEQQRLFSEQLAAMQSQLGRAQADAAAVRAITGPPMVTVAADGIAAKLAGHKAANPDVPLGHFDAAIEQAAELAKQARALADGQASAAEHVSGLAGKVERFLTRTHPRASGKALDFSALLDELDVLLTEAEGLAGKAA